MANVLVPLFAASVKVNDGLFPVQNVSRLVSWPVPESVVGEYVGVRLAGPESVTVHERLMVVETLKLSGAAYAPPETAAKKAAPATSAVPVRVRFVKFTEYETFRIK